VGDAIDSHTDNICSQYTTAKSSQLESSKNSQSIHMSSFSCQEEALVSKVEETMHPRGQHCDAFVDIILSQATSAISLISEVVALNINDTQANDDTHSTVSNQHSKASPRLFRSKFTVIGSSSVETGWRMMCMAIEGRKLKNRFSCRSCGT